MGKRKYTHLQMLEPEILSKREAGQSLQEIAEHYGLEKEQVRTLLKRRRMRQRKLASGGTLKAKGRPGKDGQPPHQREQKEIERLRMENKLLRDFLQLTGRK